MADMEMSQTGHSPFRRVVYGRSAGHAETVHVGKGKSNGYGTYLITIV